MTTVEVIPGPSTPTTFSAQIPVPTEPANVQLPPVALVEILTQHPSDSASDILAKLLGVDGAGSMLDADLLDGQQGAWYLDRANHTGVQAIATVAGLQAALDGKFNTTDVLTDAQHGNRSGGALHAAATASVAGFMTAADKAKLDGIETGATADMTPAEILTAIKTVDGAASGLDADLLDGLDSAYLLAFGNMTGTITDVQHGNRGGGALHALATPTVAGFYIDAPNNANTYARQGGNWVIASVFVDAPNDGKTYARQSLGWVESVTKTYVDGKTWPWSSITGTPTTIAGYGITDAYTKTAVDTADNLRVLKAGDTMTGNLLMNDGTINHRISLFSGGQVYIGTVTNHNVNIQVNNTAIGAWASTGLTITGNLSASGSINATAGFSCGGSGSFNGNVQVSQAITYAGGVCIIGGTSAYVIYLRGPGWNNSSADNTIDTAGTYQGVNMSWGGSGISSAAGQGWYGFSSGANHSRRSGTASQGHINFYNNVMTSPSLVGQIVTNGSGTSYNPSSDERLKDFTGPLDPAKAIDIIRRDPAREFTWKVDGSYATGWGAQTSYEIDPYLAQPPILRDAAREALWAKYETQLKAMEKRALVRAEAGEKPLDERMDPWIEPTDEELDAYAASNPLPDVGEPGFHPWMMDYTRRIPIVWAALSRALDVIDELQARVAALEAAR